MKNILLILCISVITLAQGQTAIGKHTVDGDGLLDFGSGTNKGIILPAIETLPSTPENGTFLLDKNDQKVKMFENNQWVELSDEGDITDVVPYHGTPVNTQTIIGAESTTADGVLVLEATNKSMILPKVASPHLNVSSPYPGMMCYDTDAKALAVFDGSVWSYWK